MVVENAKQLKLYLCGHSLNIQLQSWLNKVSNFSCERLLIGRFSVVYVKKMSTLLEQQSIVLQASHDVFS